MPGGLWTPGALWQFRQNLRAPDHTGVQFVQSANEPTTWQWEYTLTEDDLPLVDTLPRGWQPRDSYYALLLNVFWQNGSGASQTYNMRLQVQNATWGTFEGASTGFGVAAGAYGYFWGQVHGVNVGATLRLRLWATVAQNILGIRLIMVPRCYGVTNSIVCVETIALAGTSNTAANYAPSFTGALRPSKTSASLSPAVGSVAVSLLTPMGHNKKGARLGGWVDHDDGTVLVSRTSSATLYSNGYYGFFNHDMRVLAIAPCPLVTSLFPERVW